MKGYYRKLRKFTLKVGDDVDFCLKDKIVKTEILNDNVIVIWSFGERYEEE